MARYFAFNNQARGLRSSTLVTQVTTAGRFDSAWVNSATSVPTRSEYLEAAGPFDDGSTSLTTLWLRADLWIGGVGDTSRLITWYNGTTPAYQLEQNFSNQYRFQRWNGSSWVQIGSSFLMNTGTLYTLTIKLVANTSCDIWLGTSLVYSASITGETAVTKVQMSSPNNGAGATFWSQVMGADYDIRSANYKELVLTGNGTYTAGTGTVADVNELNLDDATGIVLSTVGQKRTLVKNAYTVPSGKAIVGVVLNIRGKASSPVADLKALLKSGASESSTARSFASSLQPRGTIITLDPATGAAFSQAALNAAEVGFEAA